MGAIIIDVERLAERLALIPGVVAVSIGGSRALGQARPESDWDFGLYYQDNLEWERIKDLGFNGTVVAPGAWGRLMNGGAWLMVEGQRVDILFRDVRVVEQWTEASIAGYFEIDAVPGYLAGMPTYALAGELALGRFVHGTAPKVSYPPALRLTASERWSAQAAFSLTTADQYAAIELPLQCAGNLARAALARAHALLAERGDWVVSEKRMLQRAELDAAGLILRAPGTNSQELSWSVSRMREALGIPRAAASVFDAPG
jgi:hypothetical protein